MINDIRSLRLSKKLRQKELAALAQVSVKELSQCERGLILPHQNFFVPIAYALNVDVHTLYQAHQKLQKAAMIGEGYTTAKPVSSFVISNPQPMQESKKLTVIDLFCGVGGFSHGFELTGKFEVKAGVDLLPDRVKTFTANHPHSAAFCTDIQTLDIETLSKVEPSPFIIIGGPPCQGFSSIRPFRTLTEKDRRNNLFEQFALIVNALRPKWFMLENVVGLLTHQKGQTLTAMLDLFKQIGYCVDWRILNAAHYGLPQRRERLIVVGNIEGQTFEWLQPTHYLNDKYRSMAGKHHQSYTELPLFSQTLLPAITLMEAIHDLPPIAAGEKANQYCNDVKMTSYEKLLRGAETTLTLHEATSHSPKMLEIIRLSGNSRADLPAGLTSSGFSSSYSRLEADAPAVTLTVNFVHPASNKCIHPFQDRALTPREGARLQGFEDSFQFVGTRSQIVKQIGNAMPPLLAKVLAESLLSQI